MNSSVFLATLGQRPEAVTMALDSLYPRYHYTEIGILHTDPQVSGIADAYNALMTVLAEDYPDCRLLSHELTALNGSPLIDIHNTHDGEAYYRGVVQILRDYRVDLRPIHLLVAGGRKAMSIYATLAASVLFGEHDRVWTVLAPQHLMQAGMFHVPTGAYDDVQVVELPVQSSLLLPGEIARRDIDALTSRLHPRQRFLDDLTDSEKTLTEMLRQHPYASNEELADLLSKSAKTVENQLRSIYSKLLSRFDLGVEDKTKRQALLDVLSGRV